MCQWCPSRCKHPWSQSTLWTACQWIEPVAPACEDHEVEFTFPVGLTLDSTVLHTIARFDWHMTVLSYTLLPGLTNTWQHCHTHYSQVWWHMTSMSYCCQVWWKHTNTMCVYMSHMSHTYCKYYIVYEFIWVIHIANIILCVCVYMSHTLTSWA